MKKLVLLTLCLCSAVAFAQNEVSLVVSADGATKTQAIDNALRSAIEQTFGTFVSANTEILNDELVKDEIATVSSGNIQKYKEVASVVLPNGNTSVTLNVTVSLKKLVKYAQSKGSECEFAGATFGANKRMYDFNKRNEEIAIDNLIKQLEGLRPVYDYEINVSEPVMNNEKDRTRRRGKAEQNTESAKIEIIVTVKSNDKTKAFNDLIIHTIQFLAMSEKQIKPMEKAGFTFCGYYLCLDGKIRDFKTNQYGTQFSKDYPVNYFYTESLQRLDTVVNKALNDYSLCDNNGNSLDGYAHVKGKYVNSPVRGSRTYSFGHKVLVGKTTALGRALDWQYNCKEYLNASYPTTSTPIFSINTSKEVWKLPTIEMTIPVDMISQISKIVIVPKTHNEERKERKTKGAESYYLD